MKLRRLLTYLLFVISSGLILYEFTALSHNSLGFKLIKGLKIYHFEQSKSKEPRILIISEGRYRNRGGHMVAAHALQNYSEDRGYAADLYCREYVIEYHEPKENIHKKLLGRFIGEGKYRSLVDWHSYQNYVHAHRLSKLIKQNKYKFIISTDYQSAFLDLIDTKVPIFVLPCDVKCVPQTYQSRKAKYLINTDVGEKYAIECGAPKANIIRIPELSFACNRELLTDTKPMLERRKELGLPLDRKVVLVQWGSLGSDEFVKIYNNLKHRRDLHLVFVCGMNRTVHNKMIELVGDNATVLPMIDSMYKWIEASDLIIGKCGIGILSEVLCKGKIIIYNTNAIQFWEQENLNLLLNYNLAIKIHDWQELNAAMDDALTKPEYQQGSPIKQDPVDGVWEGIKQVFR